eukprot:gene57842-biopygen85891
MNGAQPCDTAEILTNVNFDLNAICTTHGSAYGSYCSAWPPDRASLPPDSTAWCYVDRDQCADSKTSDYFSPHHYYSFLVCAPSLSPDAVGILHYGERCSEDCHGVQGPCTWCGAGYCCSWNGLDTSNGCEGGGVVGMNWHVCSPAPPTPMPPTKAPRDPCKDDDAAFATKYGHLVGGNTCAHAQEIGGSWICAVEPAVAVMCPVTCQVGCAAPTVSPATAEQ